MEYCLLYCPLRKWHDHRCFLFGILFDNPLRIAAAGDLKSSFTSAENSLTEFKEYVRSQIYSLLYGGSVIATLFAGAYLCWRLKFNCRLGEAVGTACTFCQPRLSYCGACAVFIESKILTDGRCAEWLVMREGEGVTLVSFTDRASLEPGYSAQSQKRNRGGISGKMLTS